LDDWLRVLGTKPAPVHHPAPIQQLTNDSSTLERGSTLTPTALHSNAKYPNADGNGFRLRDKLRVGFVAIHPLKWQKDGWCSWKPSVLLQDFLVPTRKSEYYCLERAKRSTRRDKGTT